MISTDLLSTHFLSSAVAAYFLYVLGLVVQRLFFSPIAKYPGPKLAAATYWYEFYYDVIKGGKHFKKLQELHSQYGPIVRVNPGEVHISDSSFYDTFYLSKLDKDAWHYANGLNVRGSAFGTMVHEMHRPRRAALSSWFSRSNIETQSSMIWSKIERLCKALDASADVTARGGERDVMRIDKRFESLTIDIITQAAYGFSYDILGHPEKADEMLDKNDRASRGIHLVRHFPIINTLMESLPEGVVRTLFPDASGLMDLRRDVSVEVKKMLKGGSVPEQTSGKKRDLTTVFQTILGSALPIEEKTERYLVSEGVVVLNAGSVTTARSLHVALYYMLRSPHTITALRAELDPLIRQTAPSHPTWSQLEELPYLAGIVKEGLRLGWGASTRLPRVLRSPLTYREHVLPAGTVVSMSSPDVLMDPEIFVDPTAFVPERWIEGSATEGPEPKTLEKYLVAFGRGARMCAGMQLALAEMHMALAGVMSRFDFELVDTDDRDIVPACDFMSPYPEEGRGGVRVVVKRRLRTEE